MRIAALVLGLFIGIVLLVQACAVLGESHLTASLEDAGLHTGVPESTSLGRGALAGIAAAFLAVVGAAFALRKPYVACGAFWAGGIAALAGSGSGFGDLYYWAWGPLILAFLLFAFGGERRDPEDTNAISPQRRGCGRTVLLLTAGFIIILPLAILLASCATMIFG